jgi:bifunctional UDP-N-acetylglucosamine pyrophosphorylase/glucosamine-1-phosphate N-acetyltransferase
VTTQPAAVIVLAAGEGTRMKSATPKVLHPLGGRPLVGHALRAAQSTGPGHLVLVLRHQAERVRAVGKSAVSAIVEQKDATEDQRAVREVNSGVYAFEVTALRAALAGVGRDNAAGGTDEHEDVGQVDLAGGRVEALALEDEWEIRGVNDRVQLADLAAEANRRTLRRWMLAGVTLEPDVTLRPGVQLHGSTRVATGAVLGPDCTLTDVEVGAGAVLERTHGSSAVIGAGAQVGPFAYLRPGTRLGADGKIGTFVETKNATIGRGSKVPHLSYVGDATIGEHSNIGAASVFVNYDGVRKAHTTVGDHVRMGSDNMYVAPVTVGDGAYSGAGTVIRKDVPAGALAINVAPQRNMEGWTLSRRPGTPAAEAAQRANEHSSTDRESQS